jgi:hypothetical protein
MATRARCDRDQAVGALLDRLARKAIVDHVVQRDTAPAVDRGVQVLARAERGDDDRHLPLRAGLQIAFEAIVGLVDDLVHRERCRRAIGVGAVVCAQFLGDPVQPFVEHRLGPGVERGERPDDPRLALRDHQFGTRDDEERRPDDGQSQVF